MKAASQVLLFLYLLVLIIPITQAEVAGIPTGLQLQAIAETKTTKINTVDLQVMLDEELDMLLIDIRTANEIKSMGGQIDAYQNINIPRGWLEFRVQRVALSKDIPIVVYCGGGLRSSLAVLTLQQMGYTDVKNYSEGFLGWQKAQLPIKP